VELHASMSLLLIFALISANLALGAFAAIHPEWSAVRTWGIALLAAVLFFLSVTLHELSHAVVGRRFGIPVRRITLFIFGGMAHADNEPPSPRAEFWMALAGPIMSLALAALTGVLGVALLGDGLAVYPYDPLGVLGDASPLATLLLWLSPVNLVLGLFNLVPGFPLDGGRVLRSVLWWWTDSLETATRWATRLGQGFAWFLIGMGLFLVLAYFMPGLSGNPLQGFWLILIGWFLNNAARASFLHMLLTQTLAHVYVRDVMRSSVETVSPDLPLDALVREYFMNIDQRAFPVTQGQQVIGLVRLGDVQRVPPDRWEHTAVHQVMTTAERMHTLSPDDDAMQALHDLNEEDPLPVVQGRELVGVARREDILKWLALHRPEAV
jgi:Zn-dependent protease/predicted transcriptional regulator